MSGGLDVSVITVSYECRSLLAESLASLDAAVGRRSYEVIVVDNQSTDGVVEMLRHDWPSVAVFEMGENAGFARANNGYEVIGVANAASNQSSVVRDAARPSEWRQRRLCRRSAKKKLDLIRHVLAEPCFAAALH